MNLHRSDKVPDWEKVPPEKWNKHQRRAAKTHGIDTPGNRWTIAGKYNAATLWGAVGTHGLAEVAEEHDMPRLEKTLRTAEKVSTVACVVLGAIATKGYLKSAFEK